MHGPSRLCFALRSFAAVCIALITGISPSRAQDAYGAPPADLKDHLSRLVRAYPDWISAVDDTSLVLKTGARFPVSDGNARKSFDQLLEHPDIDDMFYATY